MFCALINTASSYLAGADAIQDTMFGYSDSFRVPPPLPPHHCMKMLLYYPDIDHKSYLPKILRLHHYPPVLFD